MEMRGHNYGVHHFFAQKSGSLNSIVQAQIGLEKSTTDYLLHLGAIYLNEKRLLSNTPQAVCIAEGDYLRVHTQPRRFSVSDLRWSELIVYSNSDFLVVNKPAGIPTHASVDNREENVHRCLEKHLQHSLFVTHRLDVPTSGLLVFAKTKSFLREFNNLLTQGKVRKFYEALVEGVYAGPLHLVHFMQPSPRAPKIVVEDFRPGYQECRLKILEVLPLQNNSVLKIELLTGRTHQIRTQLAAVGHPLVGDSLYNGTQGPGADSKITLRCIKLEFLNFRFDLNVKDF